MGGDLTVRVIVNDGRYFCDPCRIESPLPAGYPAPTPPGAIELKRYPTVRRAEVSGGGDPDRGMSRGFWPLFQHIRKRDIAMTSPVEVDYHDWSSEDQASAWTMSFLYRTADLGPTGRDGIVTVTDAEPVTVLALGLRGAYDLDRISQDIDQLRTWLASQDEWEAAGDLRAFYYNGPYVPDRKKWSEAQIPVRRKPGASSTDGPPDTP
ncbi:MAG: heme-binding protein [Planctomycetota bacterium]|nr:heme-binding protein [Planctomycetota bacterium]